MQKSIFFSHTFALKLPELHLLFIKIIESVLRKSNLGNNQSNKVFLGDLCEGMYIIKNDQLPDEIDNSKNVLEFCDLCGQSLCKVVTF